MSQGDSTHPRPARAGDVMSTPVVAVRANTSVQDTAALLLDKGISAAPVLDEAGAVIGMISEGDLLGRSEEDRLNHRDWWLDLIAHGGQMESTSLAKAATRPVRDVMHAPVVTIDVATPVRRIAEMLRSYRVKRLPVLDNGRLAGIVTRADLLRIVAELPASQSHAAQPAGGLVGFITGLMSGSTHSAAHHVLPAAKPAPQPPAELDANAFKHLVERSKQHVADAHRQAEAQSELARSQQVKRMLQEHLDEEVWQKTLDLARSAAESGAPEFQVLQFPSELCSDGGRRIDIHDPSWPESLRGEAADFYLRWERELKPAGFGLQARILDYPHGKPGDVGLFLTWGE